MIRENLISPLENILIMNQVHTQILIRQELYGKENITDLILIMKYPVAILFIIKQ